MQLRLLALPPAFLVFLSSLRCVPSFPVFPLRRRLPRRVEPLFPFTSAPPSPTIQNQYKHDIEIYENEHLSPLLAIPATRARYISTDCFEVSEEGVRILDAESLTIFTLSDLPIPLLSSSGALVFLPASLGDDVKKYPSIPVTLATEDAVFIGGITGDHGYHRSLLGRERRIIVEH